MWLRPVPQVASTSSSPKLESFPTSIGFNPADCWATDVTARHRSVQLLGGLSQPAEDYGKEGG